MTLDYATGLTPKDSRWSNATPDILQGTLLKTLTESRPTLFFGVPRVYEKIQEKMMEVNMSAFLIAFTPSKLASSACKKKPGSNCSLNSYSRLDLSYEIPYTIRLPRATRAWRRRWATGRRRPPMSITRWYCLLLNNIWKRLTLTLLVVRSEAYWWIGRVCWLAYCTVYKINWIQINLLQISISECLLYQFVSWSLLFIIFFLYFLLLTLLFLPSKKLREHLAHQFNLNWSLSFMF